LEQIKLLTAQKYGKSSEKVDIDDTINEVEVLNDQIEDVELKEIRYFRRKNKVVIRGWIPQAGLHMLRAFAAAGIFEVRPRFTSK
jgi:hypothetical protein